MEAHMDNDGGIKMSSSGRVAVEQQGMVLMAQIRARTIQRVGLYLMSAFFLLGAVLIMVFAPTGRETMATLIGVAMVVVAAGSAGYGAFGLRLPGVEASFRQMNSAGDAAADGVRSVEGGEADSSPR
jgi:hypothetical protein